MKKVISGLVAGVGGALISAPAWAAVALTDVDVDVATVETLAATVLIGLAAMWAIRKLVKTINRT